MDMSSFHNITAEAPEFSKKVSMSPATKRARRSSRVSLFGITATDPTGPEYTGDISDYSPEYKAKLTEEHYKWREAYEKLKDEYLTLKIKPPVQQIESDFSTEYANYQENLKYFNDAILYFSILLEHKTEIANTKNSMLLHMASENNKHINKFFKL